ncbi:MAG TPA: EscU/YscU/HrcU family type III secretion system export apparatus switch protein [Pirellulales bacterium]|jgi:flagellar biosynthetic protein FlhB
MAEHLGDKTHAPTPHRRQQAREQGQVARSQELAATMLLLGALAAIWMLGRPVIALVTGVLLRQLGGEPWLVADLPFALRAWNQTISAVATALLPLLGLILLVGCASHLLQVGFQFAPAKLLPDWSRLDPLAGLRRMASMSNLQRVPLGLLKLAVVGAVSYYSLYARRNEIMGCGQLPIASLLALVGNVLFWTTLEVSLALLALSGLDYALARWKHERDMRMTTQELREEMKNLQGDPAVIARRRAMQRSWGQSPGIAAVAEADAVITDGDRSAVAVRYDAATMTAPIVVAKGAGRFAARVRDLANEQSVPVVERPALAQRLARDVAIKGAVPQAMYAEVAALLAEVFQAAGKTVDGA